MLVRAGEKIVRFLRRQAKEIRQGGLPVLLRKTRTFLVMVPAPLIVLVVRALRPVVVIRFGHLPSARIGYFVVSTELYLCERETGMHHRRTFDVFYHHPLVCNQQLKKMWDRILHVSPFAGPADWLNRLLPGYEKHALPPPSDKDIHGLLGRTQVHLSFTPQEERRGVAALWELGIPDGTPFVCLHSRDSAYLEATFPNGDWHYHDHRDSHIKNFIPAAEELVRRGYFAVRTGAVVKEPLPTTNPRIIDYATKGRTEFLDIFLGAKCRFYLGDPTGFHGIPTVFRRPRAVVNLVPPEYAETWLSLDLCIPKKLWLREERRFLTFSEVLNSGVQSFNISRKYEQLGIEIIENTPEEITALAIEMDERLKGTWQTTEEDEELQRRFRSLLKRSGWHRTFLTRIGAEFLRQNREWLD